MRLFGTISRVSNLRKLYQKINRYGSVLENEPMRKHTTFSIGGPADLFFIPDSFEAVGAAVEAAEEERIPVFILGSGANILVSDLGIRGLVIDFRRLDTVSVHDESITAEAGAEISKVSEAAADSSLSGMEFIYSMPGSVGGSVWMNARCYGVSLSSVLDQVTVMHRNGETTVYKPKESDFDYKKSPFQGKSEIILNATFRLQRISDPAAAWKAMERHKQDRESKGHFTYPCAGSAFKNNRAFGEPSGKIIDSLGLRGYRIGGAQVSEIHANIIVNRGNATAEEVSALLRFIEKEVKKKYGFSLQREIISIGQFPSSGKVS